MAGPLPRGRVGQLGRAPGDGGPHGGNALRGSGGGRGGFFGGGGGIGIGEGRGRSRGGGGQRAGLVLEVVLVLVHVHVHVRLAFRRGCRGFGLLERGACGGVRVEGREGVGGGVFGGEGRAVLLVRGEGGVMVVGVLLRGRGLEGGGHAFEGRGFAEWRCD